MILCQRVKDSRWSACQGYRVSACQGYARVNVSRIRACQRVKDSCVSLQGRGLSPLEGRSICQREDTKMYIYIYMCICIYLYVYMYIFICVYVYIYMCIYIYIYMCIFIHLYVYIYIFIWCQGVSPPNVSTPMVPSGFSPLEGSPLT